MTDSPFTENIINYSSGSTQIVYSGTTNSIIADRKKYVRKSRRRKEKFKNGGSGHGNKVDIVAERIHDLFNWLDSETRAQEQRDYNRIRKIRMLENKNRSKEFISRKQKRINHERKGHYKYSNK